MILSTACYYLLLGFIFVGVKTQQQIAIELCNDELNAFECGQLNVCICVVRLTEETKLSMDHNTTITLNYADFQDSAVVLLPKGLLLTEEVCHSFEVMTIEGRIEILLTSESSNLFIFDGNGVAVIADRSISLELQSPEEVREAEGFELFCIPSKPNVTVVWTIVDDSFSPYTSLNQSEGRFTLYPILLNHRLRIENATAEDSKTYICQVEDNPDISINVSISVRLKRCEVSVYAGLKWGPANEGDAVSRRCSKINSRFSDVVMTTRTCLGDNEWSDIDFGACTLKEEATEPFILVWMLHSQIADMQQEVTTKRITMIVDEFGAESGVAVIADSARLFVSPLQMENLSHIFYSADLSFQQALELRVSHLYNRFFDSNNSLDIITSSGQGIAAFYPSSRCGCVPDTLTFDEEESLWPLCVGFKSSPCNCKLAGNSSKCQCVSPFIGTSSSCVPDSDRDSYPDVALFNSGTPECPRGCARESDGVPQFCCEDTCRMNYNPVQTMSSCRPSDNTLQCTAETDSVYGFHWGFTDSGATLEQPCGLDFIGNTTRLCDTNGIWMDPDVSNCLGVSFLVAMESATLIARLLREDAPFDPALANFFLEAMTELATITKTDSGLSRLPLELQASARFARGTVDYLLRGGENVTQENLDESESIVQVLSNLVNLDNLPGSTQLSESIPESTFSEDLLYSAERYGLYLSALLDTQSLTVTADNILVNAQNANVVEDLVFPTDTDLDAMINNSSFSILKRLGDARIIIPAAVLKNRKSTRNNKRVLVSNILFQNIEQFLRTDLNNDTQHDPITLILSSQVGMQRAMQPLPDNVTLTFTATNQSSDQNFSCVFFDFAIGAFSTEGVTTKPAVSQNGDTIVECISNHLTSFAVLVNVNGIDLTNNLGLQIQSYIGIGISLVCLLATIIFFLSFGKSLISKGVHNFVHLNLAIALFLAYLLFAVGVELAAKNLIACQVVTALLQYLFLAVFCWMLCEGVMLYLMLVVVFSTLSKKWWFFMLLGWSPPVPFVVIGLATVLDQYGVHIAGELAYCWLSSGEGQYAIWTFVAPMLAILLINAVFLVIVLISLIKSQHRRLKGKGKRVDLVKSILKASFVLLPLLGLTWVFGLLIVTNVATVFAWIFTVLHTLQGAFIFLLHVIRHEKIWAKIRNKFFTFKSKESGNTSINRTLFSRGISSSTGTGSAVSTLRSEVGSTFNGEDCVKFPAINEDSDDIIMPQEDSLILNKFAANVELNSPDASNDLTPSENKTFQLFPQSSNEEHSETEDSDQDLPIIYCNTFVIVVD